MSQVKIQGNASGTGIFTVSAPNSNTDRTLTLPDGAGTLVRDDGAGKLLKAQMPTGSVLQVVQVIKTDTYSMSSTGWANVTGLSASITPSSTSNKILILSSLSCSGTGGLSGFLMKFTRNGSDIFIGDSAGSRARVTWECITSDNNVGQTGSYAYLDSPSSTSSVTYNLQIRSSDGPAIYINRSAADPDASSRARGASSIILLEIAG